MTSPEQQTNKKQKTMTRESMENRVFTKTFRPAHYLAGVRLPHRPFNSLWDVYFSSPSDAASSSCSSAATTATLGSIATGTTTSKPPTVITAITPHKSLPITQTPHRHALLLPALTHPHIHLDKAFLHFSPLYEDLLPQRGTFAEALRNTKLAKERFTLPDLLNRGRWVLAASVESGVNAIRAFVEVDATVGRLCLDAGIELREQWKDRCHLQLVCFAQDPVFSGPHGEGNRSLMEEGIRDERVEVLGSTPYVESDDVTAKRNIDWAVDTALACGKHLDFHLDYNLDEAREPLVWYVIEALKRRQWTSKIGKRVMLGHCTRLTLFSGDEWARLAKEIRSNDLPVSFVGLPTSDMYMASSPQSSPAASATSPGQPRGTLLSPHLIRKYGLDVVLGINNVGNAFTPYGNCDPLSLACLGVGLYQSGTESDAELLYECVSTRARASIGLPAPPISVATPNSTSSVLVDESDPADLMLAANSTNNLLGLVPRCRRTVASVVWDPPLLESRSVVTDGKWGTTTREEAWNCDCVGGTTIFSWDYVGKANR